MLTPFPGFGDTARVQTVAGGSGAGDLQLLVDLFSDGDDASLELRVTRDVALNAGLSLSDSRSALLIVAGRASICSPATRFKCSLMDQPPAISRA